MNASMSAAQRADALEEKMARELDYIVVKSRIYQMADGDMGPGPNVGELRKQHPNAKVLMGDDPRLPAMPEKPTLMDFFKYRFGPSMHLLQSARHAVKGGLPEKMVLACLLHDISTAGFIRGDHGYWGAQPVEPYVDEEVTWGSARIRCCASIPTSRSTSTRSYVTVRRGLPPDPYIQKTTSGCGTTNGTCRPADHRARHLFVRPRCACDSQSSRRRPQFQRPNRAWLNSPGRNVAGDDPLAKYL